MSGGGVKNPVFTGRVVVLIKQKKASRCLAKDGRVYG